MSLLFTHAVKLTPSPGREGRAIFPTFAFMSHSCCYNARHAITEDRIAVYSQAKIQEGEEITITYR